MGRLKALAPALRTAAPVLKAAPKVADVVYRSPEWRGLVARVKRARGAWCCVCGSSHRVIADHIVEVKDGGAPFDASNIQLLCQACHNAKTAKARAARARSGVAVVAPMARPEWFRKVHVPTTLVCGPPGSGKSTWVSTHSRPGDLVISFDLIAERLFGVRRLGERHGFDAVCDVLRARNEMLGDLMRPAAKGRWPYAWLILLEPVAAHRQWWADRLQPERIIVLEVDSAECRRRCETDAAAGDARTAQAVAEIDQWWSLYTPRRGDTLVVNQRK